MAKEEKKQKTPEEIIFNETLMQHFEKQNSVGLAELILFGDDFKKFVENESRRDRLLRIIVDQVGWKTSPIYFAQCMSYDHFRSLRGVSEIMCECLRLYLLYQCGVDWHKPDSLIVGF